MMEEEESELEMMLSSNCFQVTMAGLILLNAVVIGLETDVTSFPYWDTIENAFLIVFTAELALKLYSQGIAFYFSFRNVDLSWNVFDVAVISLGIVDVFMSVFLSSSSGSLATLFRIIRLLRIMRLFRIVKFLKQLYLLAFGFVEAVQAIFWVTLLMSVVLYVCAIVMVRTCGRVSDADPHAEFLQNHFSDIGQSMLTLFVLMSSPNLPMYIEQDGLLWDRPFLLVFLICFIILGSFGMIALLTGVISESLFEKNQIRLEEARKEQEELINKIDVKAEEIHAMWANHDGEATKEDIIMYAMPLIGEMFEEGMVDFTHHNLAQLVDVMDMNSNGLIGVAEFKKVVTSYASGLKPLTIQEVYYNSALCLTKLNEVQEQLMSFRGLLGHGEGFFGDDGKGHSAFCGSRQMSRQLSEPSPSDTGTTGATNTANLLCLEHEVHHKEAKEPCSATLLRLKALDASIQECAERQLVAQRELRENMQRCVKEDLQVLQQRLATSLKEVSDQLQDRLNLLSSSLRAVGSQVLGGFHIGEKVLSRVDFKTEAGWISRGDMGTIRGPSVGEPSKVNVDFPNLRGANLPPTDISKEVVGAMRSVSPVGHRGCCRMISTAATSKQDRAPFLGAGLGLWSSD